MSDSKKKYWLRFHLPDALYLLLLLTLAGGSFWLVRHETIETPTKQTTPQDWVTGFANETELTQLSKNGELHYQAILKNVEYFGGGYLKGKEVVITQTATGQPKVVMQAEEATWHQENGQVFLQGNVRMIRDAEANDPDSRPLSLTSKEMNINLFEGLAQSAEAFELKVGENYLTGQGFQYDYQTRDLQMGSSQQQQSRIKAVIKDMINSKTE